MLATKPDPETWMTCDYCLDWTGQIKDTGTKPDEVICCPKCGKPVTVARMIYGTVAPVEDAAVIHHDGRVQRLGDMGK